MCKYEETLSKFNKREDKPKGVNVQAKGIATICDVEINGAVSDFKPVLEWLDKNDPLIDAIRLYLNGEHLDNIVKNNYSGRKILASDKKKPKQKYKKNWSSVYKRIHKKYQTTGY